MGCRVSSAFAQEKRQRNPAFPPSRLPSIEEDVKTHLSRPGARFGLTPGVIGSRSPPSNAEGSIRVCTISAEAFGSCVCAQPALVADILNEIEAALFFRARREPSFYRGLEGHRFFWCSEGA
jgi:hypothetical protein